jgi:flavin reductase (DIM6/NTAB) family NADH-FMN oxidoreductase RutF
MNNLVRLSYAQPILLHPASPAKSAGADAGDSLSLQLKQAMRNVACTVYVITLSGGGRRWGLTATAVSSLSLEPPSILACVNRNASIHSALMEAGRFCLNALREDQRDVAAAFGAPGLGEERFETGRWRDFGGAPAICDAVANILCRRVETTAFGTHTILIGEVEAVSSDHQAAPLIYRRGGFC